MILCISHTNDFYTIDLVMQAIEKWGYKAVRLNTDRFDHSSQISFEKKESITDYSFSPLSEINFTDIKAVWNRKIWRPSIPKELNDAYSSIFLQEYISMRKIFFDSLQHAVWMNPLQADRKVADNKIYQLRVASECGLITPPTLMTNNFEKVKQFFADDCKGDMIAKLHGVLSHSMEGNGPVFPTSRIKEEDFDSLSDGLQYCPMIFQPFINKSYELRVVYTDGEIFAGKINTNSNTTDWRQNSINEFSWEAYNLSLDIKNKISEMMKKMSLLFGVIDIIKSEEGNYVFLEINPQGEWGMLQKFAGLRIAETIAEKLIKRIK